MQDRLYFRQLLSGRDFATDNGIAQQMVNFAYLIGDRVTSEAIIVDPAYDVDSLLGILEADEMTLVGAVATHYHPDHIGGTMMGYSIDGIEQLLNRASVPIHVQSVEAEFVTKVSGVRDDLVTHESGDIVTVGEVDIQLIHTPGHTPGSQCLFVENHLVSGDTLFLDGCGRTDLPGGDAEELYHSLTSRLAAIPDTALLCPGHQYSHEPSKSMGATRRENIVFRPNSLEQWLMMFGQG